MEQFISAAHPIRKLIVECSKYSRITGILRHRIVLFTSLYCKVGLKILNIVAILFLEMCLGSGFCFKYR